MEKSLRTSKFCQIMEMSKSSCGVKPPFGDSDLRAVGALGVVAITTVSIVSSNSGRVEVEEHILFAAAVFVALCILAVVDTVASAATASRASLVAAWQGVTSAAAIDCVFNERGKRPVIGALVF
jgi:hypothetical protein